MKTYYQTFKNADMTEGRGPMLADIAFALKEDAKEYARRQQGIMGLPGEGWDVRPMLVMDNLQEALSKRDREILTEAMLKLSPDERRVLGIRD